MTTGCIIDGCHRPSRRRGMCEGHYKRLLRHGSPTAGERSIRGDASHFVEAIALPYNGSDCLIWPFRRDRYGYARMGRGQIVSRVVCIAVHGDAPSSAHQAAHSCGNGNLGCVNPSHIHWSTPRQNQMDRVRHGTHNRGSRHGLSKLSEIQVLEIFALKGRLSQQKIAAKFGVSPQQIGRIHRGENWAWLTSARRFGAHLWQRDGRAA